MAVTPYLAPLSARFQRLLTYRSAAAAGFVTQCWWGGLKLLIFDAFYRNSTASHGLSLAQTITYVWLGQALWALLPTSTDPEIAAGVRDGSIAHDRLRPVDTYTYWFARAVGLMLGRAAPRSMLLVPFALWVLPLFGLSRWALALPHDLTALCAFMPALALGVALCAATLVLANTWVVYSGNERGVNIIFITLVFMLSGNEVPLVLFPDWLHGFLLTQPFVGLVDIPFRIYCGALQGPALWRALGLQAFWLVTLMIIGRAFAERTFLRMEVQGG